MKYDDMDEGDNFLLWALGVPPQEHLDDIGYKKHTAYDLYKMAIKRWVKNDPDPKGVRDE